MSKVFGEIRQIAFVVSDIDQAMHYWSGTLGVGPFFIKRQIRFSDYIYRGKACPSPEVSIALANSGFIQVELIQQHDDLPSIYKEFLDAGQHGLQHIAAWHTRDGFDDKKQMLLQQGMEIAQQCTIPSSGVRLIYFATAYEHGGTIFEIADLLEPGQYDRVMGIARASKDWEGEQPVIEVTQ